MMNSTSDQKRVKDTGASGNGGRFASDARDESAVSLASPESHGFAAMLNAFDDIDVDAEWATRWLSNEPYLTSLVEDHGYSDTIVREEVFYVLSMEFLGRTPLSLSNPGWAAQHAELIAAIAASPGRAS